jgi:uncharacterized protein (TIGR02246 family)
MRLALRLATSVVCLAAALVTQLLGARGQEQARPGDAAELAKRESAIYVKAFNDRNTKDLAALLTPDADFAFLQGPSVERLEFGLVRGGGEIVGCHEAFFSLYPDTKLTQTVLHARLIRPDLLIADVDFEIKGFPDDAGPIRGRSVILRVNEAGTWKIAAERNVSRTPATE